MKAPRRVPWTSYVELAELYEMLFAPGADIESRRRGLARMSIYISSPSCPSFIHLLHSLVAAELLPYPPPRGAEETQRMRMMMGMAVVRFVNGMVDPLQNGPYARPISHLAATLDLPPSLIALRHRATHEDLPPLPLLRTALAQCIAYLHHNSFLPLLASSSAGAAGAVLTEREIATCRRVSGLLRKWKKVMKTRLREKEVREEDASGKEMKRVRRELEGEVGGVEAVVRALAEVGSLVPIAKRKRSPASSTSPTTPSLKIWQPLLEHLASSTMPELPSTLSSLILDILLNPFTSSHPSASTSFPPTFPSATALPAVGFNPAAEHIAFGPDDEDGGAGEGEPDEDESYRWGMAVWLVWIWGRDPEELDSHGLGLGEDERRGLYRRLAVALLHMHDDAVLTRLHTALLSVDPSLQAFAPNLLAILPSADDRPGSPTGELKGLEVGDEGMDVDAAEGGLEEMERRLAEFEQKMATVSTQPSVTQPSAALAASAPAGPPGWRRLTAQEWSPCPIGCLGTA
ncbi:hypothetical protein IAT38_007717 [Cryptococcus sp. DSM 104549]